MLDHRTTRREPPPAITPRAYATAKAAIERVLPDVDGAGAARANAAAFLHWLWVQDFFVEHHAVLLKGVTTLDEVAERQFVQPFTQCSTAQQDRVLELVQQIPHPTIQRFFVMLIRVALSGFLSDPRYGGNTDGSGWRYVGVELRLCERATPDLDACTTT
jgi:gluconate 2-dehydrogenase gamma chain